MPGPSSLVLLLLILPHLVALAAAQRSNSSSSSWQTLSGGAPLVIARGGFSGLFPDSSSVAYSLALLTSPEAILWCDVQLTKDSAGICFPYLNLDNASDIGNVFTNKNRKYPVNGIEKEGWFTVDFTLNDLANVFLMQGIYSRRNAFDGLSQILTVEDVARENKPSGFWLNIQHDAFFTQHNLSMRLYVLSVSRRVVVNYISSPEVNFLRSINTRFNPKVTKLVFRFLNQEVTEPTTNQTYGSLLKNLTFIKTFATGILVPKIYIWPVDAQSYLQPHTSVVSDAHKEGLEVYASDFVNDDTVSYNYSYDPVAEYLSFIDNGDFSVDGVLSDFPITPSAAINCYSHMAKNESKQEVLVTSYNGASGDFPGCTDMAYNKAITDGADVIDCSIQMTQDGIPICLKSMDLKESTNVVRSPFTNLMRTLPELNRRSGIFTFDLTWSDIEKNLTPAISNPYVDYNLYRNPNYRSAGKFLTFSDFLALAKNASSLSGVLISIENAAYLAEQEGMSVTDAVLDALSKAGYDNKTAIKVMIQSSDSNVLKKFKETTSHYEFLYQINETIRDALNSTIEDIKKFADSVVVTKASIYPDNQLFLTGVTDVVPKLKAFGLLVYVQLFSNEFVSQAWDFFSDASVEINSFVIGAEIDGVITDFPMTAARYRKNRCLKRGNNTPPYMQPVQSGSLIQVIPPPNLPPAEAPFPVLTDSDVNEAPLPSVSKKTPSAESGTSAPPTTSPQSGQPKSAASIFLSILAMLLAIKFATMRL